MCIRDSVNTVFYTGVRYDRAKEFVTDTKKVHQKIPLIGIEDLQNVIPLGCTPVAVELVKGAKPLPEYTHPERAFYIFGPEDGTLDKTVRAWCTDVVYIPTVGCMNPVSYTHLDVYKRQEQVKAGKLRLLGISSPKRVADLPNVATWKEQGLSLIHI